MRLIVILNAAVWIYNKQYVTIKIGLFVLLDIDDADTDEDMEWLTNKIIVLRIFDDAKNAMNESVIDKQEAILLVSHFNLHASTQIGSRLSNIKASKGIIAIPFYEKMIVCL